MAKIMPLASAGLAVAENFPGDYYEVDVHVLLICMCHDMHAWPTARQVGSALGPFSQCRRRDEKCRGSARKPTLKVAGSLRALWGSA